jgi:FkbM family methyltransferase
MMGFYRLLRFVWTHPLNTGGRLTALGRVFRWQIASRLMPGPIAFSYAEGTRLFATRGMTGATGNWYCGLHEVQEMAFVLHLLREGEHFVDVGANIGSYSILAAGVGAQVTALEPIPETFAHLESNIYLNGFMERVRAYRMGISDRSGVLRFTSGLDCVNHVLAAGEKTPSIEVPVTRLDDLIGPDIPLLIKIDVEGHESAVLRGAEATLAHPALLAVIMETNGSGKRYGVSDDELVAMMRHHGFGPYAYDPFSRQLRNAADADGNTVFVRDVPAVQKRVQSARRFRLVNSEI